MKTSWHLHKRYRNFTNVVLVNYKERRSKGTECSIFSSIVAFWLSAANFKREASVHNLYLQVVICYCNRYMHFKFLSLYRCTSLTCISSSDSWFRMRYNLKYVLIFCSIYKTRYSKLPTRVKNNFERSNAIAMYNEI